MPVSHCVSRTENRAIDMREQACRDDKPDQGSSMSAKSSSASSTSIRNDDPALQLVAHDDCLRQHLPETLGRGYSNLFKLDPELHCIETHYAPRQDLSILTRTDNQETKMVVTLALQGHSRFKPKHGDSVVFKQGYTSITTFRASEGTRDYQGQKTVNQLRFVMGKTWLTRHFGEQAVATLFDQNLIRVLKQLPTSTQSIAAAWALLRSDVADQAKPLFRQGLATAILASELSGLLSEDRPATRSFGAKERAMAHHARDILLAEYQNPPSVEALSRRVGTNQFKLKQLFHHYFDNTPYGLLLDIRMKEAHQLLQSGHCSVGMAAAAVGYNHASNFSAAFGRYFGFPPKRLAGQD